LPQDFLTVEESIYSAGYGMLSKKVMRDRTLPVGAKALYAYICTFAGSGTTAWPGRKLITNDLNINKDTYTKYLKVLKDKDYIRVIPRLNKQGRFAGNNFVIVFKPCPKNPDTDMPPCPKKPDTEISDTNINRSLIDHNNCKNLAKNLSIRKKNYAEYQERVKTCTTSQPKKLRK